MCTNSSYIMCFCGPYLRICDFVKHNLCLLLCSWLCLRITLMLGLCSIRCEKCNTFNSHTRSIIWSHMASLVWCAQSDICRTHISSHHILISPFPPHQFPSLTSPLLQIKCILWTYSSSPLNSIRFCRLPVKTTLGHI